MTQPIQPSYPTVQFLIRHGDFVAVALGALPALAGLVAVIAGCSAWWLVAGLVAAPVVYLFARCFVELVRIIGDTLLPR